MPTSDSGGIQIPWLDVGLARAEFPPSLSRSATRPTDPATEAARASWSSTSATSSSALARAKCCLIVYRLAFTSARRRTLSTDEVVDPIPELLELRTISTSRGGALIAGAAGVGAYALQAVRLR